MTKRNFRSPGLQHKNKWSDNFHDFLRNALQKEPRRRPTATELLKVSPVECTNYAEFTNLSLLLYMYAYTYFNMMMVTCLSAW